MLCDFHEHAAVQCLAKTGHQDDGATAERLRKDLAQGCTPGRWCPPVKENP